jgi:hypothetical protein
MLFLWPAFCFHIWLNLMSPCDSLYYSRATTAFDTKPCHLVPRLVSETLLLPPLHGRKAIGRVPSPRSWRATTCFLPRPRNRVVGLLGISCHLRFYSFGGCDVGVGLVRCCGRWSRDISLRYSLGLFVRWESRANVDEL